MDIINLLKQGGVHETEIRRYFGNNAVFRGTEPVFDHPLYLLGFSNRSGSNLLAAYLRTTEVFSGFYEQLIHSTVRQQAEEWGAKSFPDLIRIGTERLNNGKYIHGYKASWDQIAMLYRFRIPAMYTGVQVIHITRDDLLGQGISYHIANQTKRWSSLHKGVAVEPAYDRAQISRLIGSAQQSSAAIQSLCTIFDIPRHHITYEGLTRHPRKVVYRIGALAGADLSRWVPPAQSLKKQADEINETFRARYLAEAQAAVLE